MTITLRDAAARPVSGASIAVEAEMTHPGMSPAFGESREVEPGRYQARIDFTMGGDWVILLHIKKSDGKTFERQVDAKGVRSR